MAALKNGWTNFGIGTLIQSAMYFDIAEKIRLAGTSLSA